MKCGWLSPVLAAALLVGCSTKQVDLTPGTTHEGVVMTAVPLKQSYKHGETVTIRLEVKNTTKREVPLLVDWRDPNFGMSVTRTLRSKTTEYELEPLNRTFNSKDPVFLTNFSFMLVPPGVVGLINADTIREAAPKGGKKDRLPAGTYTYTADYMVKTPYDATYELGGKREKLPMDEGDARSFLNKAPRGLWRAECTFTVTEEQAPPPARPPRGWRPMGN